MQEHSVAVLQQVVFFEVVKRVQYGRALFLCGSLQEWGEWDPKRALRLEWGKGDRWRARVELKGGSAGRAEFKFAEGGWEGKGDGFEWERGSTNRHIQLQWPVVGPISYFAEWNMQHYIFLLRTQDFEEKESYYICGSVEGLGNWHEHQAMRRLGSQKSSPFVEVFRNNPQFAEQANFSRIFMFSLLAGREVESFAYYYAALGESLDSDRCLRRTCRLAGGGGPERVGEFQWQGSRVVIDDCATDKMILQRYSNTIYLASRLHPAHFPRLLISTRPSAILFLFTPQELYCPTLAALTAQAQEYQLLAERGVLEGGEGVWGELRRAVELVQKWLQKGHRVVVHVSNRAMRLFPIHMLYLVLFAGHTFGEALEIARQREHANQEECKKSRQLYSLVSAKLMRGRIQVKM